MFSHPPENSDHLRALREAGFEASRAIDDGIVELLKGYRMLGRGRFQNV